jgi:hypothetical protein
VRQLQVVGGEEARTREHAGPCFSSGQDLLFLPLPRSEALPDDPACLLPLSGS